MTIAEQNELRRMLRELKRDTNASGVIDEVLARRHHVPKNHARRLKRYRAHADRLRTIRYEARADHPAGIVESRYSKRKPE